ncbi:MAG: hypothetical protein HZB68_00150 [Candidatus Aenigmarchaeota archaeon]|nr:hypothetical protein [Candidatus Aenigmarchaeota archaeon]
MKGQTGLEFMLIMAISLAILIPLYAYMTSYSNQTRQDLKFKALEDNLESLAEAADIVYSQGYPAKMTINFYVPESTKNFSIINDRVIVMHLSYTNLGTDIAAKSEAIVNGTIPINPGNYRVSVTAQKDGWVNISY